MSTIHLINQINLKQAKPVDNKLNVEIFKFGFYNSKIIPIIAIRFLRVKNRI
jgi:hypothetical protein